MKLFITNSFRPNSNPPKQNTAFKASPKEKLKTIQRLASESITILDIDAEGFEPSAKDIAVELGLRVEEAYLKFLHNPDLTEALIQARAAVNELKTKLGIPVFTTLKS